MRPHVVIALLGASLVACSGGADDGSAAADDPAITGHSGSDRGGASPIAAGPGAPIAPPAAQTHGFDCRSDAFCEDFESADPAARWSGETGAGFSFVGPSATKGAHSLRVASAGGAGGAPAFLRLDGGSVTGTFSGALVFALRFDATPQAKLGGPKLVLTLPSGDEVALAVVVRPDGIALEQRATTCPASTCRERADVLAPATAGVWHEIVLGFEVNESPSTPYGRIEMGVDGADLTTFSLTVPFFAAPLELRAGITQADTAPSAVQIDDVMFFTK